jgi:hypothetical protein
MEPIETEEDGDVIIRFFARLGVHYAWVVAATTFFAALVAAGAAGSVGVMMLPLQLEFGWTSASLRLSPPPSSIASVFAPSW